MAFVLVAIAVAAAAVAGDLDERGIPFVRLFRVGEGIDSNILLVACFVRLDRRFALLSASGADCVRGNGAGGVGLFISFVVTIVLIFVAVRPPFVSTITFFLLVCINRG